MALLFMGKWLTIWIVFAYKSACFTLRFQLESIVGIFQNISGTIFDI